MNALRHVLFAFTFLAAANAQPASTERAFPSAEGWAATTPGGRNGKILRVTTLAPDGPGSFLAALNTQGPRTIVFEVGGVIDLGKVTGPRRTSVAITEPFLTIAGQTAPSPGITFTRGGLAIDTHDVIIRHIRVRPGAAGYAKKIGWEPDGIDTSSAAHDIIVDHCSLTWAVDENLSASGKPFTGANPDEWRKNTSHRITFSHNIIAEGLSHSTHASGEHSKGSLIMDNVTDVLILGNLYAHCSQRHPLAKGGVWVAIVNNLMAVSYTHLTLPTKLL
jgi:pectate lyase